MEANEVVFNNTIISYKELLYFFWRNVDPTNGVGQFCDHGHQYLSAIYCRDDQCNIAFDSFDQLQNQHPEWPEIDTKIFPVQKFWYAEDYHQDYYEKNPGTFMFYKTSCGRVKQLKHIWGLVEYQKSHRHETFHADPVDPNAPIKPDKPVKPKPNKKVPKFGQTGYWTYIINKYLNIGSWSKKIIDFLRMFDVTSD